VVIGKWQRNALTFRCMISMLIYCHDPNPGSMTGNAGAVPEGHPARAKPQNEHIKRIIYSKIRSIS
jgi:hypothetical protein